MEGERNMKELDFYTIGSKIRERRKALGITQEYIAERLDVNPSHISNIECGRAKPSLIALVKIANVLQCSVDYFLKQEYFYEPQDTQSIDEQIIEHLKCWDPEKKEKLLKIMDVL